MLLISTLLSINDRLTRDKFYKLLIEWNQNSPHEASVISNLKWNGERKIVFGDEFKRLSFDEFENRNIARYEKVDQDGAQWTTDFVMDFDEMKMAIQLYRFFQPNALRDTGKYSTPYFIKMLSQKRLLADDFDLPTTCSPIEIDDNNCSILASLTNGGTNYQLPVVYVSKNIGNRNPVNVKALASQLGGAAHVLVQQDIILNDRFRECCNDKNAYNGAVEIYYPGRKITKRFMYWTFPHYDNNLHRKIVTDVFYNGRVQLISPRYTWSGIKNEISLTELREREAKAKKLASATKNESDQLIQAFDRENDRLKERNKELMEENQQLRDEIRYLQEQKGSRDESPLIFFGNEKEFFPGEIKDIILSVLNDAIEKHMPANRTRRADIIRDIIQSNDYAGILKDKADKLKTMLTGYRTMEKPIRQFLEELGFEITGDGKHYKLKYFGDERYTSILPKTSSDARAGNNAASKMRTIFF